MSRSVIFHITILVVLFARCEQNHDVKPHPEAETANDPASCGWLKLRQSGDHMALRKSVSDYLAEQAKAKAGIPAEAYYYMAFTYQTGHFDMGLRYCDSALSVLTPEDPLAGEIRALKGSFLRKQGHYREAIDYLTPHLINQKSDSIRFKMFRQLALNYRKLNHYDSAIIYSQKAERLATELNNLEYQYYAVQSLANIHSAMEEFEQSLLKEIKLLDIALKLGKDNLILSSQVNLAASYFDLDKPDSALLYYSDALRLAEEMNDLEHLGLLHTIYAGYLISSEQFTEAKNTMKQALTLSEQSGRKDHVLRSYYYLSYTNLLSGNFQEAEHYAHTGISLARELEVSVELASFYELLSEIFKSQNDYKNALKYSEEYRLAMDSVLNVSKMQSIQQLSAKYESEKKEQEIDRLKQENEIQELTNANQRNWIIFLIITAILTVITVTFFYQKKITLQKEQTAIHKQQLLRSQVNPHFIFNALTSIRGFLFDKKDLHEAVKYLGKFAKLMRLVLDHSSREWVTLEEELEALRMYLEIQKMRFDNEFTFEITVDPAIPLSQVNVPPLLAQPFLENAIEHGFKNIDYEGKVEFTCSWENDLIRFSIIDNGIGINHVTEQRHHESRALAIFKQRMEILSTKFKSNLTYLIRDLGTTPGKTGTLVEFALPIRKAHV